MSELQRLVLSFKGAEIVIHALYRSPDGGPGPNTKARRREVAELARSGLTQALEALEEGPVEMVGTSGFTQREDIVVAERKGVA